MRNDEGRYNSLPAQLFQVAWVFLLITALTGILLRYQAVSPIDGFAYGNWLHAHSHIAYLGWIFNAFFGLTIYLWNPFRTYRSAVILWSVLQIANLGMLISFPWQGYGLASIFFSTLHMVGAVLFAWVLWRSKSIPRTQKVWVKAALLFMLLSTLGPLCLGPLAAMDMRDHPLYSLSLYWYLHFQYNGWFVFFPIAVIGAIFPIFLEKVTHNVRHCLVVGVCLTYGVSAFWLQPPIWVYALTFAGAVLQLYALSYLLWIFFRWCNQTISNNWMGRVSLYIAIVCLMGKSALQIAACFPYFDELAHHRYTIIAFLHLVFLGWATMILIYYAQRFGWIDSRELRAKIGFIFLVFSFSLSQAILVWPVLGSHLFSQWLVHMGSALFLAAVGQFLGLLLLFPNQSLTRKTL